jgi:hypothetical protein
MRARTVVCLLAACCCAALAGCTTAQTNQPANAVKAPKVGRPPAPASVQAALSSEAFTPYSTLGLSSDDGLAPGEYNGGLAGPCMTAAGYPGVTGSEFTALSGGLFSLPPGMSTLGGSSPWGGWGYLGAADAQQYGFNGSTNAAATALGTPGFRGAQSANEPSVPAAEQAAADKCRTIVMNFVNGPTNGSSMAVISTLSNDIISDMARDRAVIAATRAWSACMAKNGYSSLGSPQNVFGQEEQAMYGNNGPNATVSPAVNQAQITAAVTDASCTQSSDLAGIYFAVQASYEQQLVSANRQALTAAVSYYRTIYAKELKQLPALLRTTKARAFHPLPGKNPRGGTTGRA